MQDRLRAYTLHALQDPKRSRYLYDQRCHPLFSDPATQKHIQDYTRQKYSPSPPHDNDAVDPAVVPPELTLEEYERRRTGSANSGVAAPLSTRSPGDEVAL